MTSLPDSKPVRYSRETGAEFIVPDVTGMSAKEAAHAYLDAGLMPHPWRVKDDTKVSAYSGFRFDDIEETHESIDKWRRTWRCGLVVSQASGLIAADVDDPVAFEAWDTPDYPDTATARTGRDGGIHLLFDARGLPGAEWPKQGNIPGGQVKSNGFIAVEPSLHPNGNPYRWIGKVRHVAPAGAFGRELAAYRASQNGHLNGTGSRADRLRETAIEAGSADPGSQHDTLRDYAWELSKSFLGEDECLTLLRAKADVLKLNGRPWTDADLLGLFRSAREKVIPDASPDEIGRMQPIVSSRGAARFDKEVRRAADRLRVQEAARRLVGMEGWQSPAAGISLAETRMDPPAPPRQIIKSVFPEGFSDIAGQFKAGKTTLGLNVADALASGEPFLGAYPVDFPDGAISYWNLEVDEAVLYAWFDRLVKSRRSAERIFLENLRGWRIDLSLPIWQDWAIKRLRDCEAAAWIIDPKGRMLTNENDNSEYNNWFSSVELIAREAEIEFVLMFTHAGHASPGGGDASPRARGASAQMGNTDANLSYRHGGNMGERPPDSRRYLSGFGRGIDLDEITLEFSSSSGRLSVVEGAPGRRADKAMRFADKAVTALTLSGKERLNSTELQEAIGGAAAGRMEAINAAVEAGLLVCDKGGPGKPTWYSLPAETKSKVRDNQ